jgi:hypothetical protein
VRELAALSVVVLLGLAQASPTWANNAGAGADQGKGTITGEAGNNSPSSNGSNGNNNGYRPKGGGAPPQCTGRQYGDLSPRPIGGGSGDIHYDLADPSTQAFEESLTPHPPGSGAWYYKYCGPGDKYFAGVVWLSNGSGGGQTVNPAQLAQDAKQIVTAQVPRPAVGINPPADQLVQLMTWLWIDTNNAPWQPVTATATAGPVTSRVTATPYEVDWDMGNGDHKICDNPGTPYTPGATPTCTYTYRQSSAGKPDDAFQVTATTKWHVTWTATGAPGGGNLGDLSSQSAPVAVRVAENQAINNG